MAYDRYDNDSYSRGDNRERGRDRERGGFFGGGRDRDDDRFRGRDDHDRSRGREGGGFFGGGDRERDQHRGRDRDGDRIYGRDDRGDGLPIDETSRLIASNKVEGTAVFGGDGRRLGSIYNFMVDKRSGKAEYAVMTYGGFLGLGTRYYPLPWRVLSYDTRAGGYRIELTERDLERAPSFDRDSEPRFDRDYDRRINDYYGLSY